MSFILEEGGLLLLQGPNGSGKTSLLRALGGLLPCEGVVEKRAEVTYIGHRNAVHGDLTVREHLTFWQALAKSRRVIFLADILDRSGLAPFAERRAGVLSEGQRQRLALCRLLLEDTPLWLLDEPADALDDAGVSFLAGLIAAHRARGGAAVIATHHAYYENAAALMLEVA